MTLYFNTHTHSSIAHERGLARTSERERVKMSKIIFILLGFSFATSAYSIYEEVAGFSPLWFPRGKSLCLLSLVIIVVHVILSDKILDHIE